MKERIPANTSAAMAPLENPLSTTEGGEVWRGGDGSVLGKIIENSFFFFLYKSGHSPKRSKCAEPAHQKRQICTTTVCNLDKVS
jgi:hypothetical protein